MREYYRTPGRYTNPSLYRQLLKSLPDDDMQIIKFIKQVLIHPIDARDGSVRFNYKKVLRKQADYHSVDDILTDPKVKALLDQNTGEVQSTAAERGIMSCDHHAVLFASILRLKGKAVRLRCGYATYLVPNKLTPHWICEVYDDRVQGWVYIDPEQARFDVDEAEFLCAGSVWLGVNGGEIGLENVLSDYRNGLEGVKYRLLSDMNAIMKNELLMYEWLIKEAAPQKPNLLSKPVMKLDENEKLLLDQLAELSLDVDKNFDNLSEKYETYVQPENLGLTGCPPN